MRASDAFGLAAQGVVVGTAVVAAAAALSGGRLRAGSFTACAAWSALAVLACLVPVGEVSAAERLRGIVGDPSVTSVLLMALAVLRPAWLPGAPSPRTAALLVAVLGAFLYLPLFTAAPPFGVDLHAAGWSPAPFLAAFGAWSFLAWLLGAGRWVALAAAALLAWGAGAVESDNVLDALVDPGLAVAGLAVAIRGLPFSRPAVPR